MLPILGSVVQSSRRVYKDGSEHRIYPLMTCSQAFKKTQYPSTQASAGIDIFVDATQHALDCEKLVFSDEANLDVVPGLAPRS